LNNRKTVLETLVLTAAADCPFRIGSFLFVLLRLLFLPIFIEVWQRREMTKWCRGVLVTFIFIPALLTSKLNFQTWPSVQTRIQTKKLTTECREITTWNAGTRWRKIISSAGVANIQYRTKAQSNQSRVTRTFVSCRRFLLKALESQNLYCLLKQGP